MFRMRTVALAAVIAATEFAVQGGAFTIVSTSSSYATTRAATKVNGDVPDTSAGSVRVPLTYDEMVSDVASAVSDAYEGGVTRQTIRILLPRDPSSGNLGQYYEEDASTSSRWSDAVLVPPDETWQGGIMQLYRAAVPTCVDVLRRLAGTTRGNVPPRVVEDRSVDESGVDGCGLLTTVVGNDNSNDDDGNDSNDDDGSLVRKVACVVQPTQEIVNYGTVDEVCEQDDKRLVLLVNPQWRNIDDALDSASKSSGVFGMLASFIGGKGGVLDRLDRLNFVNNVYTIEGYVCKGGNIRLVKRFDSDWVIFAENDSMTDYVKVGTSASRPTYQDCDKMLDDRGIGLKYARDIGLAPKFEE